MAGVIDTNLLLYGVNSDAPEHAASVDFLKAAGRSTNRWYLTEGILYEFLRVSTHPRVFPRPLSWQEALEYLQVFSRSPNFSILGAGDRHWNQLEELLKEQTHPAGNLFFDLRTAALMREHGIRSIYTTDSDFLQFPGIEVVNPLAS